jgi:hypothetical protein
LFDDKLFAFEDYEMGIRCIMNNRKLKIKLIEEVTFIHDHRFQSKKSDREAVLERYNIERLTNSYLHIENKFKIKLNHKWENWTDSQINLMTKSKRRLFFERISSFFFRRLQ